MIESATLRKGVMNMTDVSIKCAACGGDLTAENVEELAQKLQEHARDHHGIDMTLEMAVQKVKEANPI
jgi:predicted small metal-binding protein